MQLHNKILELKQRASPISYSSVSVNALGELKERENLLDQRIVEGYGCIWGQKNMHQERFFRGAFAKSIKENGPGSNANYEIKFRDEHGRACALFEILEENEIGLYFRTKPLDSVSWCDDLLIQLRSKTINNFSNGFKYIFKEGSVKWNEQEETIDIYEARLLETSATAIPSDLETFAVRTATSKEDLFDLTEDFIRGLPRKDQLQARRIFDLQKSLFMNMSFEQRNTTHQHEQPTEKGVDYSYLIKNL